MVLQTRVFTQWTLATSGLCESVPWWCRQMEISSVLLAIYAASDAELLCFPWSVPELTLKQTMETPVIWDDIVLIMTSV